MGATALITPNKSAPVTQIVRHYSLNVAEINSTAYDNQAVAFLRGRGIMGGHGFPEFGLALRCPHFSHIRPITCHLLWGKLLHKSCKL